MDGRLWGAGEGGDGERGQPMEGDGRQLAAGVEMKAVKEWLRHANLNTRQCGRSVWFKLL